LQQEAGRGSGSTAARRLQSAERGAARRDAFTNSNAAAPAQPAPAASRKPATRPATPASTSPQPAAAATPPAATPAQPPQLGDIVTPDQQRQLNAAIDQSLARAQASLASVANRELTKDQQGLVEQIRNIIKQAQASRSSDLPGAKSLAGRAEVLAKDLAESFH
jgi:hypothetical protein